jgi:hypothetical protein
MANADRELADAVVGLLETAGLSPVGPGLVTGSSRHYVVLFSNARVTNGKVKVYSPTRFSVESDENETFNNFFELRRYVAIHLAD